MVDWVSKIDNRTLRVGDLVGFSKRSFMTQEDERRSHWIGMYVGISDLWPGAVQILWASNGGQVWAHFPSSIKRLDDETGGNEKKEDLTI